MIPQTMTIKDDMRLNKINEKRRDFSKDFETHNRNLFMGLR